MNPNFNTVQPKLPPLLVDSKEACRLLSISLRKLSKMTSERQIPFIKMGKSVRFRVDELDNWTKKQMRPENSPTNGGNDGQHQ